MIFKNTSIYKNPAKYHTTFDSFHLAQQVVNVVPDVLGLLPVGGRSKHSHALLLFLLLGLLNDGRGGLVDVQPSLDQVDGLFEVVGRVDFGFGVGGHWGLAQEGLVQGQNILCKLMKYLLLEHHHVRVVLLRCVACQVLLGLECFLLDQFLNLCPAFIYIM